MSALGKCRLASGIRSLRSMREKHIARSAFSKLSGCVTGTSRPVAGSNHSSIPQKCPPRTSSPSEFTSRATSGSCSVGPMGPQIPTGLSSVRLAPRVDVFERFGEVEVFERFVKDHPESGARESLDFARGEARGFVDEVRVEAGVVPPIGGDGAECEGLSAWGFSGRVLDGEKGVARLRLTDRLSPRRNRSADGASSLPRAGTCATDGRGCAKSRP